MSVKQIPTSGTESARQKILVEQAPETLECRLGKALDAMRIASFDEDMPVVDGLQVDSKLLKRYQELFDKKASKQTSNQLSTSQTSIF